MIIYVDAENRPGNWTNGIELMSDRDEIRVSGYISRKKDIFFFFFRNSISSRQRQTVL